MPDNIVNFRPKQNALFNDSVRKDLEESVKPYTESPVAVVNTVEQTICTHIVLAAREASSAFAIRLGNKIADLLLK